MASGLIIKEVYLSRIHKSDLESKLEDNLSLINMYQGELIALGAYTHPTILDEDRQEQVSVVEYVPLKVRQIMEELDELYSQNHLIRVALDNLEDVIEA